MTKSESLKWLSFFYHKEPEPLEVQIAVLSAMVANGLGAKKAKAEDFIISPVKKKKDTPKEMPAQEVGNSLKYSQKKCDRQICYNDAK